MKECYVIKKFNRGKRSLLPVAPETLQGDMIKEAHSGVLTGGHFEETRTYNKLANQLYFRDIHKKIKQWVQTCDTCQRVKKTKVKYGKMTDNPKIAEQIMEELSTDVLGPLKIGGRDYVILFICSFSKYIYLKATQQVNSNTIVECLEDIMVHYPTPRRLKTE